ncbi:MFS transporter [Jannaschia aquimarina]|uniref:YbjJ protein n=1 Tax=Jannaschia aquimarina TaxID=935700 RepID=A0A0D1EC31_9RHOB|nr:MFS transporter [Jannaschia aquimarina]KIT14451.1 Inner membrane protein YbjJ [Jannaschia aquimarina]SNT29198.1 Major Facilitator Superfamily protein [Jannaschia aquimarina]
MQILSALALSRAPVLAFVAVGTCWGCIAAMAPVLKARIGVDDATFGLLLLGTAIGLSTTLFVAPRWDRRMAAWAMPTATMLLAVAALGPGWVATPLGFFLALTLLGACSGLTDVVMNARVSEIEARSGRSLMNANHAMFSVAYATSAVMTGALREAGWAPEEIFVALAVVLLGLAPFQVMDVSDRPETGETADTRLPVLLVGVCGGVVLVAFMAEATVEAWSALHIERTLGGGAAEGAFGPAMLGLTMAVGRFFGQAVAARFAEGKVIRAAATLAMVGVLIAAAAPVPAIAYLGFGLMGLGISVIGPMGLALAGRLAPPALRTAVIARVAIIGFLGFFVAPAAMGLGAEAFGLRWAFAGVAVLLAVAWPLTLILMQRDWGR